MRIEEKKSATAFPPSNNILANQVFEEFALAGAGAATDV
jgi:hypothetical protein